MLNALFTKEFTAEAFIDEINKNYKFLTKDYRNEFFYKNTLFNKLVLGKYSVNTTSAFSEVVVGKSKADFVLINNSKGMVFEIKTDLDNLDRLVYQLDDYSNAFSELYVVTSERNYYPVYKVVKESNPAVGIIVLTDNVSLSVKKKAIKNDGNLNHEVLFKLLRKKEYEQVLLSKFESLPEVKPVLYFKTSLQWFKTINITEAQKLVFDQLRKRIDTEGYHLLKELPIPIRWLVYTGNFNYKELYEISEKLNLR
ncbi:sce7726 family protein [Fredinandcohnia humi]